MEVITNPTIESTDPRVRLPKAEQLTGREHNPTHRQLIGLKICRARPCPPEQDPVFSITSPSHQEVYTGLLASSGRQRADRRSKKKHCLIAAKTKTYYRKLIKMKKQKVMSQMKGQDKIPEK